MAQRLGREAKDQSRAAPSRYCKKYGASKEDYEIAGWVERLDDSYGLPELCQTFHR